MPAVFADHIDPGHRRGIVLIGRKERYFFLHSHVCGAADGALWRLGPGLEVVGHRTLLFQSQRHTKGGRRLGRMTGFQDITCGGRAKRESVHRSVTELLPIGQGFLPGTSFGRE